MGKTIQVSGFPDLLAANVVKEFLDQAYARVQFTNDKSADIIFNLAEKRLDYDTSYLRAWESNTDIVQNPRTYAREMEQVTLNFGCQTSEEKFSWVRTTDFTASCIGQSSGLCLQLPHGMRLPNFRENFVYYKELSETPFRLETAASYSHNSTLVPIIHSPRGHELSYKIIFKVCSLIQSGCKYQTLKEKPKSPAISLDDALVYVHQVQATPCRIYFSGPENGNRKFDFLAFSSSQLRDNSLWMFAPTHNLNADDIRRWMGDFRSIRNVAKYAARLGQSFGSSTGSLSIGKQEVELIPGVEAVRYQTIYVFSDGIVKISADFASRVAVKCGCKHFVPSALQIWYGGYKGVVAVDSSSSMKLLLRPSMSKYQLENTKLDVLAWSKYYKKQQEAVAHLKDILVNPVKAQEALDLMSPGRFYEESDGYSPTEYNCIVRGKVAVAINPCLHSGDVRVLKPIDVLVLRHMVDYVVFPRKGLRPHPNECSGSDLDGDIYVESLQMLTVFADKEPLKVQSEPCLELARLFSIAVDFQKTGVPAETPPHLHVKDITPDTTTFRSFTREVPRRSYDPNIEVDGYNDCINKAFEYKIEYDTELGKLMEYYGIKTEAEILGGIMKMSKTFDTVRSLRNEARSWFKRGSEEDDLYAKVSAWYHVTYHPHFWGSYNEGMKGDHYISFPWCVYDKLVQIKENSRRAFNVSSLEWQIRNGLNLR
ncbi:RNA-directed RNA polymerase [Handroanthus impetiginosus]|uniref:RNA-dependent RNA polymerase n=1 Tax=Handroanthus impetiginosus TaxID=429701 RepID=A0A2G9G993_9LAMI|nr:RNA-directed RNA polymerase [Handroanthus impetiginosus]